MSCTVSLATLGCKTNQFESNAMQQRLVKAGYELVAFDAGAELVIVNTCTVTAATDSQSRNLIRRARRLNPVCRVVVTGCYAQVDPQALASLPGVSLVLGNEEKNDFLDRLEHAEEGEVTVSDIRSVETACVLPPASWSGRSRAFVQIQNGCDAFCSYCIIPYARGRSRSVQPEQVVEQVRVLHAQDVPEVVLTGIHVGAYGHDLDQRTGLAQLIQKIERETDLQRLRLGSIEPLELTDDLIETMAATGMVCAHLHIPLQSGDDAVLERMNRNYTTKQFGELVERLVQRMPGLSIGLDVIAGFPGETEQEFVNTCELIESLPVSSLHVFPFSKRSGTPAATMPGQLPGNLIKERAAHLRLIGSKKSAMYARSYIGKELEVVVESGGQDGLFRGISREYLAVRFAGEEHEIGKSIHCVADRLEGEALHGARLDLND